MLFCEIILIEQAGQVYVPVAALKDAGAEVTRDEGRVRVRMEDRRFDGHEHMFASAPDGSPGIIGPRAVSSMAERGTSTQKER